MIEIQSFYDELLFYLSADSGWHRHFKLSPAQKQFIVTMLDKRKQERREFIFTHNY